MFQSLAQEIATITAGVIEHSVLVTDERGYVIGSSDPTRLGSLHSPSLEAMQRRTLHITTEAEARRYGPDIRPGITQLIDIDGHIIGTIAIAGLPEEVTRFGALVQKHAELFLRERALYESSVLRENLRQQFLRDLLLQERVDDEKRVVERGRLLGVELPPTILPAAFALADEKDRRTPTDDIQRAALSVLQRPFRGSSCLFAPMDEHRFALLFRARPNDPSLAEAARLWCREALAACEANRLRGRIALGPLTRDLTSLPACWRLAAETLQTAESLATQEHVVASDDVALQLFLSSGNREKAETLRHKHLAPLFAARGCDELLRTLDAWLGNRCAPERVAASLCCHKNTLYYRLAKIHRLTGLDPRDGRDGGVLHLLLLLNRLFGFGIK